MLVIFSAKEHRQHENAQSKLNGTRVRARFYSLLVFHTVKHASASNYGAKRVAFRFTMFGFDAPLRCYMCRFANSNKKNTHIVGSIRKAISNCFVPSKQNESFKPTPLRPSEV